MRAASLPSCRALLALAVWQAVWQKNCQLHMRTRTVPKQMRMRTVRWHFFCQTAAKATVVVQLHQLQRRG